MHLLIICAEAFGEYLPGSDRQSLAVMPKCLQASKSVPPGLEAISIMVASVFALLNMLRLRIKDGMVLKIKSNLLICLVNSFSEIGLCPCSYAIDN